jgi:cation:H+ antiporter
MPIWLALIIFVLGVLLAIWATERLLEGLVSLATALKLSAFVVGAVLSGLEAENIAVGLGAGANNAAPIALGSVFGGAIFLVCVALGLAAVFFPLEVKLPRPILLIFGASPVLVGVGLVGPVTPRWAGLVLLLAFGGAMAYLVIISRHQFFMDDDEVEEALEKHHTLLAAVGLTILGIVVISVGGELVALGAQNIIGGLGIPAFLMGMVVTPAAIELEEVIRQAVPAKEGRHDVSAGNLIGTMLYFTLLNFGLVALITPVEVDPLVRNLDWPFLIVVTWIAMAFLWQGRVGRGAGAVLLTSYAIYIVLHIILR